MKKQMKTMVTFLAAATVLAAGTAAFPAVAATLKASVIKGQDDLGTITIKRVWVGGDDPIFLADDYDRIWLDDSVNVLAKSEVNNKGDLTGKVKTPMREIFRYLGGSYREDGDRVILELNGDKLELTVGSRSVIFNGEKFENAIPEGQEPDRINVRTEMADFNTFLEDDYEVVRLPFKEVFTYFQAEIGNDTYVNSIFAMVPVMDDRNNASHLAWSAAGYGNRYDSLLNGTLEYDSTVAGNLAALQNEDGGFYPLPANTEMSQENITDAVGTLAGPSTLELYQSNFWSPHSLLASINSL